MIRECDADVPQNWSTLIPKEFCYRQPNALFGTPRNKTGMTHVVHYVRNILQHMSDEGNRPVCVKVFKEWQQEANSPDQPIEFDLRQPEQLLFHHQAFAWVLAVLERHAWLAERRAKVLRLREALPDNSDDESASCESGNEAEDEDQLATRSASAADAGKAGAGYPYEKVAEDIQKKYSINMGKDMHEHRKILLEVRGDEKEFVKRVEPNLFRLVFMSIKGAHEQ